MSAPLLARVEGFLVESGMPQTVFGRLALRDPRFVGDLRRGRETSKRTARRAETYMHRWRAQFERGEVQKLGDRRCKEPRLADEALRLAGRDPMKAIELLRIAIESIQPLAKAGRP
jgi:hypothetical protein